MGMDLIGQWRKSTPKEIISKYPNGPHLHYNWTGWGWILNWLEERGIDMEEFSGTNDGERLSRKTCQQVTKTIENHLSSFYNLSFTFIYFK